MVVDSFWLLTRDSSRIQTCSVHVNYFDQNCEFILPVYLRGQGSVPGCWFFFLPLRLQWWKKRKEEIVLNFSVKCPPVDHVWNFFHNVSFVFWGVWSSHAFILVLLILIFIAQLFVHQIRQNTSWWYSSPCLTAFLKHFHVCLLFCWLKTFF